MKPNYINYDVDKMLACPCCGQRKMDPKTLANLNNLRGYVGIPFIVTSGYRCPRHNTKVSNTGETGPHTTGQAVDLQLYGCDAFRVIQKAQQYGFYGIGMKQTGPYESRFLHLDDLFNGQCGPRPWVWTYD